MTIIIEDGTGIKSANVYGSVVEFKAYHALRGNTITAGTGDIEKALIRATDYIENRFGQRFKSSRCFLNQDRAQATLTFSTNPSDGDTITIGTVTYVLQTTLVDAANNVLIGANAYATLINLGNAVLAEGGEPGVDYGTATVVNPNASLGILSFVGVQGLVTANDLGIAGNDLATTTTGTAATFNFAVTTGGDNDSRSQGLSFPRAYLVDRDGQQVVGVPKKLKASLFEYANRAIAADLNPDPEFNDSGRVVKKEKSKVGPIEEEFEYEDNGQLTIRVYPAADAFLIDYINPAGGVIH
mgnify:CR=1 FL=1